jgi:hypothetical protein
MIRSPLRWTLLGAALLPLALVACGSDDSPPPAATGGSAGSAAGTGGSSGEGGTKGDAGSAGDSGASGAAGSGVTGSIPATCDEAHGSPGCCGPDGNAYYFDGAKVVPENCAEQGLACGWDAESEFYTCLDAKAEDPSGTYPIACGGTPLADVGCPVPCTDDSTCTEDGATKCDTGSSTCVECLASADCKDPENPVCVVSAKACGECLADTDCATSKYGSVCDTETNYCGCNKDADCKDPKIPSCATIDSLFGSYTQCVECQTDAQCAGNADKKFCNVDSFVCSQCNTDFDCTDATKSKCVEDKDGVKTCGTANDCTDDDTSEPNDDGVAGASELAEGTELSRKMCSAGDESDYFKFNASDTDNVTITITSATAAAAKQKLYAYVLDAKGEVYGLALHGDEDVIKLTFLPAGTYYVQVKALGTTAAGEKATVDYKIALTRTTGTKCTSSADCAAEFEHQLFRGDCDTAVGVCKSVDGKGTRALGEVCDDDADCKEGLCGGGGIGKNQDKISVCAVECGAADGSLDDSKCGANICGLYGACAPKCTVDEECPINGLSAEPPAGKAWAFLPCQNGKCQAPEN